MAPRKPPTAAKPSVLEVRDMSLDLARIRLGWNLWIGQNPLKRVATVEGNSDLCRVLAQVSVIAEWQNSNVKLAA